MSVPAVLSLASVILFSFGLPVFLYLLWKNKRKLDVLPLIVGVLVFTLFPLVIGTLLRSFLSSQFPTFFAKPIVLILYAGLVLGTLQTVGGFVGFLFLAANQRISSPSTGLSYGIGHGGSMIIWFWGIPALKNLVLMLSARFSGSTVALTGTTPENALGSFRLIGTLSSPNSWALLLMTGAECILLFAFHLALAMLLWMIVTKKLSLPYLLLGFVCYGFVNSILQAYQQSNFSSLWIVIGSLVATALLTIGFVFFLYNNYRTRKPYAKRNRLRF